VDACPAHAHTGDSLLDSFLKIVPEAEVGKILIQRSVVLVTNWSLSLL